MEIAERMQHHPLPLHSGKTLRHHFLFPNGTCTEFKNTSSYSRKDLIDLWAS